MYEFLSECRKIEENATKTYNILAQKEHYPKKLRGIFLALSDDEKEHSRSIELAMQASQTELDVTAFISWEKIKEASALSEKYLRRVQETHVDEVESLKMAIEMEQVFVKIHIQNALHFSDNNLMNLFQSLEEGDQTHINTLKDCLSWWHSTQA